MDSLGTGNGAFVFIECLFAQIERSAKPAGNFGELRLALVIELRTVRIRTASQATPLA
jgi:hypothetical protein